MAWKKPSEDLSKFLDERISAFDVKKKKIFGCLDVVINKNGFAYNYYVRPH